MEFQGLTKKEQGKFITRYDLQYKTYDGMEKIYEMISRDKDIKSFEELHNRPADAVVLIMHSVDGERILINKEFRLAPGEWVYNFPAGLIDPGEDFKTAAERELREETGATASKYEDLGK